MPIHFALGAVAAILPLYGLVLRSNLLALLLIFGFSMTAGFWQVAAGIPTMVSRAMAELCIVMLFSKVLFQKIRDGDSSFKAVGLKPMIALFVISLVSFMFSEQDAFSFFLYLRYVFLFYLFFLTVLNLNLSEATITKLNHFLIALFVLQLPVAVAKVIKFGGVKEGWLIGTVSADAGEFSATLPLFAISFLVAFYFLRGGAKYIAWILAFIALGIGGGKRALVVFVPFILFVVHYLSVYARTKADRLAAVVERQRVKKVVLVLVCISFLVLFVAAKTFDSLNPEQVMGGSFDPVFIMTVIITYETNVVEEGEYFDADQNIGDQPHSGQPLATGRISSTLISFERLFDEGVYATLFGSGPGLLAASKLSGQNIFESLGKIGIRYGITGFVWMLNQVGLLGGLCMLALYIQLYKKGKAVFQTVLDPFWKAMALGFMGATVVFILDYMLYSLSTFTMGALTPVYFYLAAMCFARLQQQSVPAPSPVRLRMERAGPPYPVPGESPPLATR